MKRTLLVFIVFLFFAFTLQDHIEERKAFYDKLEADLHARRQQELTRRASEILRLKAAIAELKKKIKTPSQLLQREQEIANLAHRIHIYSDVQKAKALRDVKRRMANVDRLLRLLDQAKFDLANLYAENHALPLAIDEVQKQVYAHIVEMNNFDTVFDEELHNLHRRRNVEIAQLVATSGGVPVVVEKPPTPVVVVETNTQSVDNKQQPQQQPEKKVEQKPQLNEQEQKLFKQLQEIKQKQKEEEKELLRDIGQIPDTVTMQPNDNLLELVDKLYLFKKAVAGNEKLSARVRKYTKKVRKRIKNPIIIKNLVKQEAKPIMDMIMDIALAIEMNARKKPEPKKVRTHKIVKNSAGKFVRILE